MAAGAGGKGLVEDLRRDTGGTTAAILWQALFADCLRVAHSAVAADGEIGDHEIEALYEFVFTVARHYAGVIPSSYGEFVAVDHESAREFLDRYAGDQGPFGRRATLHWPGLTLCRRAAELGEPEALERYERMMTWLIAAACQVGGVTEADPRWRGRVDELDELRRALARDAEVTPPEVDLRVQAFLAPTRVFAAVQQASSVYESDPFDVESIHAEARATFEQMVERATIPSQHSDRGRMLLVLGDSGAGKTHLLRGFRRHVHEYGRGFVAYAQLHSSSDDYARYLLQHVVDSLARPYAGPSGERTGLHELASGLPRLVGEPLKSHVERLANDQWESTDSLADYVNRLVDELLNQAELASFDPDLLRVLLYALQPDQRTTSRVYKYLRCENMNAHDRRWIGDVTPRVDKGEPDRMIRELARLAFATQHAAFVLMIDQAELAGFEETAGPSVRRAIDVLHGIVSEVPSAIAVVACLSDLYVKVRGQLNRYAIDRLEKDPPIERLQINRSYPEIEAIVSRRLSWLFADAGAVYRPETPVYPIPEARLRALANHRTRSILEWCHEFQAQCAAAGTIIDPGDGDEVVVVPPKHVEADLDQLAAAWNDAMHEPGIEVPDDEEEILAVVGTAAKACAEETGLSFATPPRKNGALRVQLAGAAQRAELAIAVTNRAYQRGAFAAQIDALRRSAGTASPIAIRTLEFPRGESSNNVLARLLKAGGRRVYVDASTLRTLVAFQRFKPPFPADRVEAWRRRDRPISGLPAVAEIFDLDQ
ncbi:MAG TPA: AAA family ATPase, partial [Kofleriaceae bacterium]|nr:AAA family ATPase [Kofleriaceae bacterium]